MLLAWPGLAAHECMVHGSLMATCMTMLVVEMLFVSPVPGVASWASLIDHSGISPDIEPEHP